MNKTTRLTRQRPPRSVIWSLDAHLLILSVLFPCLLVGGRWSHIWRGARPRSWDGTGHFAVAYLYNKYIFPDTFGWLPEYFAGMPFPNFYPPAFYFLVALVHRMGVPFLSAFKFFIVAPLIAFPAVFWYLAYSVSARNRTVATASALALAPLLLDYRFYRPIGLDYLSTFGIGLYSQPLGFVFLLLWLSAYLTARTSILALCVASLLLALTVLANFFNGVTAVIFIAATLSTTTMHLVRSHGDARQARARELVAQLTSPIVALGLTSFWLFPVFSSYDYFVTRPFSVPVTEMIAPAMWGWYAAAAAGAIYWTRRPTHHMLPYLTTCAGLASVVIFGTIISPEWFPLQATRFAATLNFLLALPVGYFFLWLMSLVAKLSGERIELASRSSSALGHLKHACRTAPNTATLALSLLLISVWLITPPYYIQAFYPSQTRVPIDLVLSFADGHRDGRYLVENAPLTDLVAPLDGRALASFLGAQGNQSLSVVFREASPNSVFFNPQVNAFSASPDNFGLSSLLAGDIDFATAHLSVHLARVATLGVKYIVVVSPAIKERLAAEAAVAERYDLGLWTVFELVNPPTSLAQVLAYRPALVVSDVSLKLRRSDEYSFTRFAEEQFAEGWLDVRLAHSADSRIDEIIGLEEFGAVILDTYDASDSAMALERLRRIAATRLVVLLRSESELYKRLVTELAGMNNVILIDRDIGGRGDALDSERPGSRYRDNSVRIVWRAIREALDEKKVRVDDTTLTHCEVTQSRDTLGVSIGGTGGSSSIPIVLRSTFHPNWTTQDGAPIFATTPFFSLLFVSDHAELSFHRRPLDYAGAAISGVTAIVLVVAAIGSLTAAVGYRRRRVIT